MRAEIRIISRRSAIQGVRKRWNDQYPKSRYGDDQAGWGDGTFAGIRSKLAALDLDTASQADVDAAIGVPRWAANECDICGEDHEYLVQVGDEPDYEARWLDICQGCVAKMLAKLSA